MGEKIVEVQDAWREGALVDDAKYREMYAASVADPDAFWGEHGKRIDWMTPFSKVKDTSFEPGRVSIKWFEDGKTNVAYNCIDRHLASRGDQTAIIWEGDDPSESKHITYRELHAQVCRMANVLRNRGVEKGDRVTIYLPMIPEAAYAMLACARLGAVHSIVFGGFSPDSLASRIEGCTSKIVITADEGLRGGRKVPLKANVDAAIARLGKDAVDHVVVVRRTGGAVAMEPGRDVYYDEAAEQVTDECPAEGMEAEHPLFILYTSGSTGQPKGVVHTTGGYLVYASMTHQYVFDYREGDVYWCTADVGWVTGHSYIVYGPLANGATTLMFEGIPTYPSNARFWEVVDKHKVNIFYTAPTAIRSLMGGGEGPVKTTSRASLRVLGSVGEPINPEAWDWYYKVVGDSRCAIVDTWWQTETGGILITPLPGATKLKPGSATRPFFGVQPAMVDAEGKVLEGACEGNLCITQSWPGQMRTVYGDHERFEQTYFSTYPGKYFTGDGARRDADGYYWITGRVDDVINVSGHRMGTAEVEVLARRAPEGRRGRRRRLPAHPEGARHLRLRHPQRGEEGDDALRKELVTWVRKDIGPIASPDLIQFAPGLPKTRSGKIMRRILRKIAEDDFSSLGDTSTLAEPAVVEDLIENRQNRACGSAPPVRRAADLTASCGARLLRQKTPFQCAERTVRAPSREETSMPARQLNPRRAPRARVHAPSRDLRPAGRPYRPEPDFQTLVQERTRFGWILTVLMLLVYFGFIGLIAFDKQLLAMKVGGGTTSLGLFLGVFVILFAFLLTGALRRARQHALRRAVGRTEAEPRPMIRAHASAGPLGRRRRLGLRRRTRPRRRRSKRHELAGDRHVPVLRAAHARHHLQGGEGHQVGGRLLRRRRRHLGRQNGLAIAGDYMSAASFLGISGLVYTSGFDGLIYSTGFLVGWPIVLFLIAERLRNLGKFTFADVASFRLDQTPIRILSAVGTLVVVAFYLIAQMVGAGKLIQLLFGLPYLYAVVIVGVLMIVYVAFGGMKATTWVQVIKACLLLGGATFMAAAVLFKFDFNPEALFASAVADPSEGRRHHGARRLRAEPGRGDLARHRPDVRHRRPAAHPDALLHGLGRAGGAQVGVLRHRPDRLLLHPDLHHRLRRHRLPDVGSELLQARRRRRLRQDQGPDRRHQHGRR